jgi:diadenosine tetraphosphate (Ap4A) HIT family hydrolase
MPLSPGHLLVTTRKHREKVSEITDEEAREMGRWLRILSRVLAGVTGVWDWNIVQNNGSFFLSHFPFLPPPPSSSAKSHFRSQSPGSATSRNYESEKTDLLVLIGAAAAQIVPHVHFHIIPRPALTPELRNRSFTMFGRGQRSELDEDEAAVLAEKLRAELKVELARDAGASEKAKAKL